MNRRNRRYLAYKLPQLGLLGIWGYVVYHLLSSVHPVLLENIPLPNSYGVLVFSVAMLVFSCILVFRNTYKEGVFWATLTGLGLWLQLQHYLTWWTVGLMIMLGIVFEYYFRLHPEQQGEDGQSTS